MYDNIGGKIKGLAIAAAILGSFSSMISGAIIAISSEESLLIGVLMIITGPIIAWISSWLLFGFGQLIENSEILVENSDILVANSHHITATNEDIAAFCEKMSKQ